ncbi:MAG: hypothetical protein WAV31_06495 [Candidatus Moraniibacteriota bacterium]
MKEEADVLRKKINGMKDQLKVLKKSVEVEGEITANDEFEAFEAKIEEFENSLNALEEKAEKSIVRQDKDLAWSIKHYLDFHSIEISGSAQLLDESSGNPMVPNSKGVFIKKVSPTIKAEISVAPCPHSEINQWKKSGDICETCGGQFVEKEVSQCADGQPVEMPAHERKNVRVLKVSGVELIFVLK